MLHDFAANVDKTVTIKACDWLIQSLLVVEEIFDVKYHASDWARALYAFIHGDTDHVVMSTRQQKVFIAGVGAFRTLVTLFCARLLLDWPYHVPERPWSTSAAVAYAFDLVLNSGRQGSNIVTILTIVRSILATHTHLIKLVEAITFSLKAVTEALCTHPNFFNDIIRV